VFTPRITTYTYSTDQRFIATTTKVLNPADPTGALNQSDIQTDDGRFGSLASLQGPNQLSTGWTYDGLGRKTLETRADGTKTKWEYVFCTNPGDPAWPATPAGAATASCNTVPASFHAGIATVGPRHIRPVYYAPAPPLKS